MPDDDRHTRDRIRTLDPLCDEIRGLAAQAHREGTDPRQLELPSDSIKDRARRALEQVIEKLGEPDLEQAGERVRTLAQQAQREGPESLDLCAGTRASGMEALIGRAVSVVLSTEDPDVLAELTPEELAVRVGEEFVLGALRRYGIDRAAPFLDNGELGIDAALDFLDIADLGFGSFLKELVKKLLS